MQRVFFLCFVLFLSIKGGCQTSGSIVGRWQVVVMDNGVRYDYKTDTFVVSQALKDTLDKHKSDFFDLEYYVGWAGGCRECYFVFGKDGTYQEYRETELRSKGTYRLSTADSTVRIVVHLEEKRIPKTYKYRFPGERLWLHIPSAFRKEGLAIELERRD